ncbi:MAG: magnesium/cobalt transporter CorA [Deltaproteobacteria bacterium]|nr:MAG: magnesium/cobalt transporter CorA [Deltaproteobacteria bacterium]
MSHVTDNTPLPAERNPAAGQAPKKGLPPGSAVYTGTMADEPVLLTLFDYGPEQLVEHSGLSAEQCIAFKDTPTVTWIDIDGLHDTHLVREICRAFRVHPLAMEDALNPTTRPKVEDYESQLFVTVKMARPGKDSEDIAEVEQVSCVLGPQYVISFQERPGDLFDSLRTRLRNQAGRIRDRGPDYLLHALLDAVVDGYYLVIERFEDELEELETEALDPDAEDIPQRVHSLRLQLLEFRRLVWPLREAIGELLRREGGQIRKETVPFLRDLYDHVLQVLDVIDSERDRLASVVEMHLAMTSHQMNEVMRVLTVVSSLFIPLTFFTGLYGMNFTNMPELQWRFGYYALLGLMGLITIGMLGWFRRMKWL